MIAPEHLLYHLPKWLCMPNDAQAALTNRSTPKLLMNPMKRCSGIKADAAHEQQGNEENSNTVSHVCDVRYQPNITHVLEIR